MQRRPTRMEGKLKLKLYGVMSCQVCANKWKATLQSKGKNVRTRQTDKGVEVWAT
jgi:hypothetical protein